jgi:ribosome-associated protein
VTGSLDDDKAEDIVAIDLAGKSSIGDHMVIATGRSNRQVSAMADHLIGKLKQTGVRRISVEGMTTGDWVLIDAGDIIVHLFRPEVREFYALEKMWGVDVGAETVSVGSDEMHAAHA